MKFFLNCTLTKLHASDLMDFAVLANSHMISVGNCMDESVILHWNSKTQKVKPNAIFIPL